MIGDTYDSAVEAEADRDQHGIRHCSGMSAKRGSLPASAVRSTRGATARRGCFTSVATPPVLRGLAAQGVSLSEVAQADHSGHRSYEREAA
jgi:hypothetical protein